MEKKYLVIAEHYVLGIFNTLEEAVNYIINNPTVQLREAYDDDDYHYEAVTFDFFSEFNPEIHTKEKYVRKYITMFNGSPTYIGDTVIY